MNNIGKQTANFLLNIPADLREWMMANIAPTTLGRWLRQVENRVIPSRKDLIEKIKNIREGKEELSDWAKNELKDYQNLL